MTCRFFRLCRKPQSGAGRRYYRLVSYPQDTHECADLHEAREYCKAMQYSAALCAGQWVALSDKARQCIDWYLAGKDYVKTF